MKKLAGAAIVLACTASVVDTQPPAVSGLDAAAFDRSVRPQDDLFRYVNGGWLAKVEIPPDNVSYGLFVELSDRAERDVRAIVEDAASAARPRRGSTTQQIGDLYASFMDEAGIEALGIAPIEPELRKIEAVRNVRELATEVGYLSSIAVGGPFGGAVAQDARVPGQLIVHISQGGILLPDRDYYLNDDAEVAALRQRYEQYLADVFRLVGRPDAAADARAVVALETALARAQWTQAESRDTARTYNRFELTRLPADMPGFDWLAWARPQGIDHVTTVVLAQPSFFRRFSALTVSTPLETWKAWLTARYVTAMAPYLTKAIGDARFELFGRVLTGQPAPRERRRRGVGVVNMYLGDAVGRLYVEKHFPPSAKARVERLAANVVNAFRQAIADADWMAPETSSRALDKLSRLRVKVGYPDQWQDYDGLTIARADLVGNIQRAERFANGDRMRRLAALAGGGTGRWTMTPQTVNAAYSPALNEILLPAAVLQPPLFNAAADEAVNYGGLGALIGHEVSHGFDDYGRRFDAEGAVRDWWKPEDERRFQARARLVVDQFDAFEPLPGARVNGTLTLRENIGDLGGLSIAYRAYKLSLGGHESPVLDDLTGDQRFFMGWAQMWRTKMREPYLRQWLLSTPYAPPEYRANAIAGHMPAFHEAFHVAPGDKLYRPPAQRIRIW